MHVPLPVRLTRHKPDRREPPTMEEMILNATQTHTSRLEKETALYDRKLVSTGKKTAVKAT